MDAKEFFRQGQIYFVDGKFNESIEAFTNAIEAGERNEIVFLSRGVAYFRTGQHDSAIQDFGVVVNMNDNNYRAFFYRGTAYMAKQDYEKAIADFERTIKLKSDYGAAFFARGIAYAQLGNEYEASRSMQSAIACSEASMQWVSDHYGMFRTQFDQALALLGGQGGQSDASLTDEQMNALKDFLGEDNG